MARWKKIVLALMVAFVVLVGTLSVIAWRWDTHYFDGYVAGQPLDAADVQEEDREGYRRVQLNFAGVDGHRIPTVLTLPKEGKGPHPCLIFLHGIGQKKEFIDEIAAPFVKEGYAMATFDQYTRGERRLDDANGAQELLALRRRGALTVLETRRLVDYLETRDDIAADRIYLLGASFGAVTGSTAVAFEPRIAATVLCYGGGDLPKLFASDVATEMAGAWMAPLKHVLSWLMAPADPVHYAAQISPRPILCQNGKGDTVVPAVAGQALFDAAKDPKEIIWYESDHIGLDEKHVWVVLNDAIKWLNEREGERGKH